MAWSSAPMPTADVVQKIIVDSESMVHLFVPLTDAGLTSGGLMYAAGSHENGMRMRDWSHTYSDMLDESHPGKEHYAVLGAQGSVEVLEADSLEKWSSVEEFDLQPGDVVAHTPLTWHRAQNNTSPHTRWTIEMKFQDARFPHPASNGVDDGGRRPGPAGDLLLRSELRPEEVIDSVERFVNVVLHEQAQFQPDNGM